MWHVQSVSWDMLADLFAAVEAGLPGLGYAQHRQALPRPGTHDLTTPLARSEHNENLPINRCPSEILSHIFLFTVDWPWDKTMIDQMIQMKDTGSGIRIQENKSVKDVSQVCRRWRDVAVSDPALWSNWSFYDMKNPAWFLELERRSRATNLTIRTMEGMSTESDHVLLRHTSRIIALEYVLLQQNDQPNPHSLLTYAFPLLESLTFIVRGSHAGVTLPIAGGSLPRLKELRCSYRVIDLNIPAFSNVVDFTVRSATLSDRDILSINTLKRLEHLRIVHCEPRNTVHVQLPQLRLLEVKGHLPCCEQWLKCIDISPRCSIQIRCAALAGHDDERVSLVESLYDNLMQRVGARPPQYSSSHLPWSISFVSHKCVVFSYQQQDQPQPLFCLEIRGQYMCRRDFAIYCKPLFEVLCSHINKFPLTILDEHLDNYSILEHLSGANPLILHGKTVFSKIAIFLHSFTLGEDSYDMIDAHPPFLPSTTQFQIKNVDIKDPLMRQEMKTLIQRRLEFAVPLQQLDVAGCVGGHLLVQDVQDVIRRRCSGLRLIIGNS